MAGGGKGRPEPLIFFGRVMHARLRPKRNAFSYRVFFVRFPLSSIERLAGPLFTVDGFNLLSFHRRDHGARDGSDLHAWIRALLAAEGIGSVDGEIWLQAFPRVLGFVFNPVSFWLCHDRDGRLRAVLCEVNNTFGEHHNYLLAHADERPIAAQDVLGARKVFHVSPFCEVAGDYRFQFAPEPSGSRMRIDYDVPAGKLLVTSVSGQARPLTTARIARAFALYPWMTVAVVARIHWQALKLWLKGVRFVAKPVPPVQETTR
jgi:DUF1365 family protein